MRSSFLIIAACAAALSMPARAATIAVVSNADSGPGTLRSAIAAAANGDRIAFALPAGATTIALAGPLPAPVSAVEIIADNDTGAVTVAGGAWPVGAGLMVEIGAGHELVLDTSLTGEGRTGGLGVSGGGTLVLERAARYPGATTLAGATLRLEANGELPVDSGLVLDGGTFDLGSADRRIGGLGGRRGTVALGEHTLTIDQDGDSVFAGSIVGTGRLAKAGPGRLTLEAPQAWTGGTRIAGGVLEFASGDPGVRLSGAIEITGGMLVAPGIHMGWAPR